MMTRTPYLPDSSELTAESREAGAKLRACFLSRCFGLSYRVRGGFFYADSPFYQAFLFHPFIRDTVLTFVSLHSFTKNIIQQVV